MAISCCHQLVSSIRCGAVSSSSRRPSQIHELVRAAIQSHQQQPFAGPGLNGRATLLLLLLLQLEQRLHNYNNLASVSRHFNKKQFSEAININLIIHPSFLKFWISFSIHVSVPATCNHRNKHCFNAFRLFFFSLCTTVLCGTAVWAVHNIESDVYNILAVGRESANSVNVYRLACHNERFDSFASHHIRAVSHFLPQM